MSKSFAAIDFAANLPAELALDGGGRRRQRDAFRSAAAAAFDKGDNGAKLCILLRRKNHLHAAARMTQVRPITPRSPMPTARCPLRDARDILAGRGINQRAPRRHHVHLHGTTDSGFIIITECIPADVHAVRVQLAATARRLVADRYRYRSRQRHSIVTVGVRSSPPPSAGTLVTPVNWTRLQIASLCRRYCCGALPART